MIPVIRKPPITHKRKAVVIFVAGTADFLQIMFLPGIGLGYVLDDAIDFLTAIILTAICGFKWQFVLAFFMELIPGLDILPTWTAVALLIPSVPGDVTVSRNMRRNTANTSTNNPNLPHPPIEATAVVIPPTQAASSPQLPQTDRS